MPKPMAVPEVGGGQGGEPVRLAHGDQYLTFCLGAEHYGIDILSVTEIRGWEAPTLVPHAPDYVLGVCNLRGIIVPVLDLRIRLGVASPEYLATTVVIVLSGGPGRRTMGFVVDAVSDVIKVPALEQPAALAGSVPAHFIRGLAHQGQRLVTLLDTEPLLAIERE